MGPVELQSAPVAPPAPPRLPRKSPAAAPVKVVEVAEAPKGLCQTCRHHTACGFRQKDSAAKLYCEEYEALRTPAATIVAPEASKAECPPSKLLGLCINCDHREICHLPKPEGGVWHCNEYQ